MRRPIMTTALGFLLGVSLLAGCASGEVTSGPGPEPAPVEPSVGSETPAEEPSGEMAWLETPLTDAVTGEEFRLSDFKGKPVLLHAFAVW